MPLPDGEILENVISSFGLRRLHIASGDPLNREAWVDKIPWYARISGTVQARAWTEDVLGMHHLELYWQCRDLININKGRRPGFEPALIWWIGNVARMRDTLPEAIEAFLGYAGFLPDVALLRVKAGAPDVYVDEVTGVELNIREAGWVPEKFLFLVRKEK